MLSFDKREVVHKGNYEFATILYQLKSRERGVIVKKWAVCSGFDPCYVISVHMKSGQVTTNFVSNHFNPVLHDCRGTMMGAISRYDAPVEDVVPVRRTREHSGVAVITSSNIYLFHFKFDCTLSCYRVFYHRGPNNRRQKSWSSQKKNSIFNFWKNFQFNFKTHFLCFTRSELVGVHCLAIC